VLIPYLPLPLAVEIVGVAIVDALLLQLLEPLLHHRNFAAQMLVVVAAVAHFSAVVMLGHSIDVLHPLLKISPRSLFSKRIF
jgi:hypothetical protein